MENNKINEFLENDKNDFKHLDKILLSKAKPRALTKKETDIIMDSLNKMKERNKK